MDKSKYTTEVVHHPAGPWYEIYEGPMYVFEDGDPDPLPLSLATDGDLASGSSTIQEGFWCRWTMPGFLDCGSYLGPFETRDEALDAAHEDNMGAADEVLEDSPGHEVLL